MKYKKSLEAPDLEGADLSELYRPQVSFQYANPAKANLRKSIVERSEFENAFLAGADFSGAVLESFSYTNGR